MKRVYALTLMCIALSFLILGYGYGQPSPGTPAQQRPAPGPGYQMETDLVSMAEVGQLLVQLGEDIQAGRIMAGGKTYPISGNGSLEWGVRRRGEQTSVGIEFGSAGQTPPAGESPVHTGYQRGGQNWDTAEVADIIAEVGQTLAGSGAFVMEDHRVPFSGTALVEQRLAEGTEGRRRQQYTWSTRVTFGDGEIPPSSDDEDFAAELAQGRIRELGTSELEGADRNAVAQMFASISEDMNSGRVRAGDAEVALEDTVRFTLTHVTTTDGNTHQIEFSLRFGPQPQQGGQPEGPRFSDEPFDQPMTEVAALLQRIAAEMLENGTFELGGDTFTIGETANYELSAGPNGFSIELSYNRPRRQ